MGTYKGEGEYNNFRELLINSVWRESLAGKSLANLLFSEIGQKNLGN